MTRVALIQLASPDGETQAERIVRAEGILRAQPGVDLFVLPELWSAGYFAFDQYAELAETLDGPTVAMGRRVARDLGAQVHLGSIIERAPDGALHNTAVLIGADGKIAQVYRKIHVFGYQSLESELLTPGTTLSVVDSAVGRLGSTTCYDLRFPGLWQALSDRGAEAVVVPAAWPAARRAHWRLLTHARAVEHQVWIFACNAGGSQGGVELGGFSRVVDPSGAIVGECGAGEEVLVVDIDPGLVARVRTEFPVIADRVADYPGISSASGAEA
ncbi:MULTISPECIES: nitrilase-related carbon-nitrogen hydrolase [unclassified Leucobacter]|uniref:nitrilase-related carbon-nitrogen hydrolase n=1 Tax=unclassified Leucobacter TaxID=2621730 RepID=UPI00165DFF2E|nr:MULTISPECIES: nitrilase-related carbon-nitrogen hydrolase [unclassified Leucobacter]MBC9936462.1 carbon-nitrogen family hydrolase [Leucobacter sp. cx-87]